MDRLFGNFFGEPRRRFSALPEASSKQVLFTPDSDPGQTCGTLVHLCRAVLDYHVVEIDSLHSDHGGIYA